MGVIEKEIFCLFCLNLFYFVFICEIGKINFIRFDEIKKIKKWSFWLTSAKSCDIINYVAAVMQQVKYKCGYGGIGRRASFRC